MPAVLHERLLKIQREQKLVLDDRDFLGRHFSISRNDIPQRNDDLPLQT
ncbi:hypothetical protein FHS75_003554 [Novosphingobium marinum]|uniref:Uncharacterized protein n=1 Tax=Novosphingobium marinum TaxID=1514948 RepID=A0A7Y9Y1D0_9SPHN|nr:hypothetical protein [Novosphingobium marinum]